jgi:hypothetical protein
VVHYRHLNYSDIGKHQPHNAGVDPYFNSLNLYKLQTLLVQSLNGHMDEFRLLLQHMELRLVGLLPMLDLPLLPIPK